MKWLATAAILVLLGLALWQGARGFASELHYYHARQAFEAEDYDQARKRLERAIELNPDRAELHRALGNARHQWFLLYPRSRGAALAAERNFARAAALDPLYPYHWHDRGHLALSMELAGVTPEMDAIACFNEALARDFWNREILTSAVWAHSRLGRTEEADPLIVRLLKVDVNPARFQRLLSIRVQTPEDMDRFMEIIGDNPELLHQYARWLIRDRQRERAATALKKTLELTAEKGGLAVDAAYDLRRAGRSDLALETLARMLEQDPEPPRARYYYAELLRAQRRCPEAVVHYRKLVEINHEDCNAYRGLARCAMWAKEYEEAKTRFFQLLRCPGPSRIFKYRAALEFARAMERAGDREGRLAALREALVFASPGDREKIQLQIEELEQSIK